MEFDLANSGLVVNHAIAMRRLARGALEAIA
jgi:hypothetical protein